MKTLPNQIKAIVSAPISREEVAEKLTDLLHKEGLLHHALALDYNYHTNSFIVVEIEWLEGKIQGSWFLPTFGFDPLMIISRCEMATKLYAQYYEACMNI